MYDKLPSTAKLPSTNKFPNIVPEAAVKVVLETSALTVAVPPTVNVVPAVAALFTFNAFSVAVPEPLIVVNCAAAPVKVPVTPTVLPKVAVPFTVSAATVALLLAPTVVNSAVLGAAFPIGVLCKPPSKSPGPAATNDPVKVILLALILLVTPRVPPTVAELLTVNALAVKLLEKLPVVAIIPALDFKLSTVVTPETLSVLEIIVALGIVTVPASLRTVNIPAALMVLPLSVMPPNVLEPRVTALPKITLE